MTKRTEATEFIATNYEAMLPGGGNYELIKRTLDAMSEKEFADTLRKAVSGEYVIPIQVPPLGKIQLNMERNLALAKKLKHPFFEHLILTDNTTGRVYKTPLRYLVVDQPVRKQQQLLEDKISVPSDNLHVDDLTGQPTGVSKGSALSYPEIQLLYGKKLQYATLELIRFRGGDEKAFNQMNQALMETGGYAQANARYLNSRAKVSDTVSTLLTAAHIGNNL